MYDEYKEFIKINKKLGELYLKCYDVLYEVNQCKIAYLISDHVVMCMNDVLNSFSKLYERYISQPQ